MYVKVKNGAVEAFPYGQRDLMRDNPNTSYPRVMSDEALAEQGLYLVAQGKSHNRSTQLRKMRR